MPLKRLMIDSQRSRRKRPVTGSLNWLRLGVGVMMMCQPAMRAAFSTEYASEMLFTSLSAPVNGARYPEYGASELLTNFVSLMCHGPNPRPYITWITLVPLTLPTLAEIVVDPIFSAVTR